MKQWPLHQQSYFLDVLASIGKLPEKLAEAIINKDSIPPPDSIQSRQLPPVSHLQRKMKTKIFFIVISIFCS